MRTVLTGAPPERCERAEEIERKPQFPGIPTTSDGAGMVVWVETHITQGACAYPITSSTTMGGGYQVEVANGSRNLWGEELAFIEPESEHSAASTCEGFAVAGGRVTNFTSGQGLILMKEVLYTISGKRLPIVFHIGARAITSHSLNVHAGHDDVYGVADCGWGVLYARNAQEAGDLALISRRIAEDSETPILNVQDGFLTTHTIENVRLPEPWSTNVDEVRLGGGVTARHGATPRYSSCTEGWRHATEGSEATPSPAREARLLSSYSNSNNPRRGTAQLRGVW